MQSLFRPSKRPGLMSTNTTIKISARDNLNKRNSTHPSHLSAHLTNQVDEPGERTRTGERTLDPLGVRIKYDRCEYIYLRFAFRFGNGFPFRVSCVTHGVVQPFLKISQTHDIMPKVLELKSQRRHK